MGGGEGGVVYARVRGGVRPEGGVAERQEDRRERRIRGGAMAAAAGDGEVPTRRHEDRQASRG